MFILAGILECLGCLKYTNIPHIPGIPCVFLQYIYTFLSRKWGDVFNSNLTVVSIIINSYKSTNIPYYNTWHLI